MEKKFKFEYTDKTTPIDFMRVFNQYFETKFKRGEIYSEEFERWQNNVNWFNHIVFGTDVIEFVEVE